MTARIGAGDGITKLRQRDSLRAGAARRIEHRRDVAITERAPQGVAFAVQRGI